MHNHALRRIILHMPTLDREQRRGRILELVRSRSIHSQAALQDLLADEGCIVNQATLSRDLRDLGIVKAQDGYRIDREPQGPSGGAEQQLEEAVQRWLREAVPAQNQLVLRTPPGGAQALAFAIDEARPEGVVGTLAGDDTVLIISPDAATAAALAARFQESLTAAGQEAGA